MGHGGVLCKGLRGLHRVLKQAMGESGAGFSLILRQANSGRPGRKTLVRPWQTLGKCCVKGSACMGRCVRV
eukprot:14770063-Alexandrium_andersonii.AAC.1